MIGGESEYKWQGKAIQIMIYEFILCYMIKGGAKVDLEGLIYIKNEL